MQSKDLQQDNNTKNGKRKVSKNGARKTGLDLCLILYTKTEIGPLSYTIYKNQFEMDKDLKVRPETIKLLEENRRTAL